VLAIGYGVFSHKLLHDAREQLHWSFVAGKRAQQNTLRAEQRVDAATLAVLGKRTPGPLGPPELAQAIAVSRHALMTARAEPSAQLPGGQGQVARAPQGPNPQVIEARINARKAEMEALEAEIQSLATPEDIAAAMAAEEARNHAISASQSARDASQAARERRRRGQTATQAEPGSTLRLTMRPSGATDVRTVPSPLTPEQIAAGRTEQPENPGTA